MVDHKDVNVTRNAAETSSYSTPEIEPTVQPQVDERRLLRQIDLHVIPILFIVYIVAFLDR